MEKTFLKKNTIRYAFYKKKVATFSDFEKKSSFSEKTHLIFIKKTQISFDLEILLFQLHSTANLLQFGEKKFTFRGVNEHLLTCVNATGKHRVKKRSIWREDFPSIFYKYGGK